MSLLIQCEHNSLSAVAIENQFAMVFVLLGDRFSMLVMSISYVGKHVLTYGVVI